MKNGKKKNAFCGGVICRRTDRKYKCVICKVYMCKLCSVTYNNCEYCIDCYIEYKIEQDFKESWNKWVEKIKFQ